MTRSRLLQTGIRALPLALWLGLMTGLFIEAAGLIVKTSLGEFRSFAPFAADLARVSTRALLLSVSIACGLLLPPAKFRPLVAAVIGAAIGPLACVMGRAAGGALCVRLGLSTTVIDPHVIPVLAAARSLEFATLGFLAGRLSARRAGSCSYGWAGLAVAVIFGVAVVAVRSEATFGVIKTSEILAYAIEEVGLPIAIALILSEVDRLAGDRAPVPLRAPAPAG